MGLFNFSFGKKKQKPRIYIIEDSKTFLQTLKLKLKAIYGDVVEIRGYTESQTFLDELNDGVEVVIMDYYLDDQSQFEGTELLQQIKEKTPSSFLLVLTGENDLEVAKTCFAMGADSYMVKTLETLDDIVDEIHYKIGLSKI